MEVFNRFAKGLGDAEASATHWGGKGAGLSKMAAKGYPIPPGFTITTELCKLFQQEPKDVMDAIMTDLPEHLTWLSDQFGYLPLMSVRSGAPVSMPGMMDTILNVGITSGTFESWVERLGERAAWDSRRRLLQMMGSTALGLDHDEFEKALTEVRVAAKVETDAELTAEDLKVLYGRYCVIYQAAGVEVPDDHLSQLRACIQAVFASWMNDRAITYRDLEGLDHGMGTAVTVQAMVFGNMNENSGSGVLFTRDPSTGEDAIFAEYLVNAQGEDVVAGIRTPERLILDPTSQHGPDQPQWQLELEELCVKLEEDYRDMVDVEFTVQDGELFLLQSRAGKRSAQAAFKIGRDLLVQGVIDPQEMQRRIKPKHYATVKRPGIDPKFKGKPQLTGIGASMGIAVGHVVFSSADAVARTKEGKKVILVTHETTPEDIAGMAASIGILTQTGGATSHAAVVARGMDKPCVVGCTAMTPTPGADFYEGQVISIDGETGRVWAGEVPVIGGVLDENVEYVIDVLTKINGVTQQDAMPRPGVCVPLTDWLALTDEEIAKRLQLSAKLVEDGHDLFFDATEPNAYGDSNDDELWAICGVPPEVEAFHARVIMPLIEAKILGAKLLGKGGVARLMLTAAGYEGPKTVFTLDDLAPGETVTLSDSMKHVLGKEAGAALAKLGYDVKLLGRVVPRGTAAFELLGAA